MLSNIINPTKDEELIKAVENGEPIYESINGKVIKKGYQKNQYSESTIKESQ